jgi:hypothetical protein
MNRAVNSELRANNKLFYCLAGINFVWLLGSKIRVYHETTREETSKAWAFRSGKRLDFRARDSKSLKTLAGRYIATRDKAKILEYTGVG